MLRIIYMRVGVRKPTDCLWLRGGVFFVQKEFFGRVDTTPGSVVQMISSTAMKNILTV